MRLFHIGLKENRKWRPALHHFVLGPVGDRSSSSSQEGVRSRRRAEELCCQGDVFSVGDVDTASSPSRPSTQQSTRTFSASTSLQGGVRPRKCMGRHAFKEAREEACMRWGARSTKPPCTSRTRTEEGVYASRLSIIPYLPKLSSTMVTRTCQLDGKHAIAPRVCLQLLHQSSAVTEEAQSNIALLRVCGFLCGVFIIKKPAFQALRAEPGCPS